MILLIFVNFRVCTRDLEAPFTGPKFELVTCAYFLGSPHGKIISTNIYFTCAPILCVDFLANFIKSDVAISNQNWQSSFRKKPSDLNFTEYLNKNPSV